jgi:hypothetical protein
LPHRPARVPLLRSGGNIAIHLRKIAFTEVRLRGRDASDGAPAERDLAGAFPPGMRDAGGWIDGQRVARIPD